MRPILLCGLLIVLSAAIAGAQTTAPVMGRDPNTGASFVVKPATQPVPREWVDKLSGHRVVRLSDEAGSSSLYFHQYAFSPDGSKLIFTSATGIYQVDLATRVNQQILAGRSVVNGLTFTNSIIHVGRKTGRVYFTRVALGPDAARAGIERRSVWWIDPATSQEHEISAQADLNDAFGAVNCDETLLGGLVTYLDGRGGAATRPVTALPGQRIDIAARWAQALPMALVTMNIATGKVTAFNAGNEWLDHVIFSPTDPNEMMYCHQGPWQNTEQVWTTNIDGSNNFDVHHRTMIDEIWGHSFWSDDGATAWYQLSYPTGAGGTEWIAGTNIVTHRQTWYRVPEKEISIHVNISRDGSLFAGDGSDKNKYLMLHRPHLTPDGSTPGAYDSSTLIQSGTLTTEKLVDLSNHDYALEPNVVFTPDAKWIIFRSNMFGPSYVFMVEVAGSR